MPPKKFKLVCFDVDGTLVAGVSWLFLTEGLGCSPQTHLDIFRRARDGKISFIEGERILTKMYRKSGNATKPFIKKIFAEVKPRPEAKKLISYLKKKGYTVYLISGAIDIYVGESENDIEVFKKTGHGIPVHSDVEKLKKVAWKVVSSLADIKKIL